jgi:hypothetical protein
MHTLRARARQGNWQLNGAVQIEKTATQFPQFALLQSVTYVQLRLIKILGNCGCVAVASFLGVPSSLQSGTNLMILPVRIAVATLQQHWPTVTL